MMPALHTPRLELVHLDADAIRHLIAGDLAAAERVTGLPLPAEFLNEDERTGVLPVQLKRMEASPDQLDWTMRLMVTRSDHEVIGHCGFHGPPQDVGRAEIGYTVFEPYRGRGYAKEAARALVEWGLAQGQSEVYASVSPGNAPSLAVVRAVGFEQVGVQEDEVDGTELVFAIRRASV
jgi:[ribosomal protein S5]-alanine N-acetyltransferase